WWRIDGWIEHRGWRLGQAFLGLPEPDRVRQLVEWHAYPQTHLLGEDRTEQRWKTWVEKQGPWRWTLPSRLRRGSLPTVTPAPSWLAAIVNDVARNRAAAPHVERIMVSPNGIAIVVLQLLGADGSELAVLRIPLAPSSEPRVAHNARALDWLEGRAPVFAQWARSWPALHARGTTQGWGWTLEEHTAGTDAQSWPDAAKRHAMQVLAGFLDRLAPVARPPRPPPDA